MMRRFAAQLEPDAAARRGGALSPLYAPLPAALPPALFTVGTEDALRDDTLFMASRWLAEGLAAELEVARSRSIVLVVRSNRNSYGSIFSGSSVSP